MKNLLIAMALAAVCAGCLLSDVLALQVGGIIGLVLTIFSLLFD